MPKDHKKHVRDLILNNESYSDEQWHEIADYNRDDVLLTIPLLEAIAPTIDVPAALFRGRYATAVVDMEARGIPISSAPPGRAQEQWQALADVLYPARRCVRPLRRRRIIQGGPVQDTRGHPRVGHQLATHRDRQTGIDRQGARQAGQAISGAETVAASCAIRSPNCGWAVFSTPLAPMATAAARSCRSGPAAGAISRSGRDKVFLLSLPSWLHGLIAPPPGWGMALLDWKAQEIGIAAGLSNDPALIADFQAGDPHMGFAIRAGLAPTGATAETPRRGSHHGQADLARQSIRDVEVRRRGAIRQVTGMGGNHTRAHIVMPIRCLSSGSRT